MKSELEDAIDVMTAHLHGATVERQLRTTMLGQHWLTDADPCWDWQRFRWRVKAMAKREPLEFFVSMKALSSLIESAGTDASIHMREVIDDTH